MNAQLSTFSFEETPIRVLNKDGEPWFVAKDVCDVLELTNNRKAISALDEDEKGVTLTYTLGGQQEINIINESGLYILILRSRKAMRKGTPQYRFRKWVTSEVLLQIRKTGNYGSQEKLERASKMAAVVAAQVSHDTFKAFMQGKDEELSDRWLVYTHWQNGKPEVGASPIPGSAHIATLEELADRIVQRDAYIFTEPEVLAKLANACLNKLAVRLQQIRK